MPTYQYECDSCYYAFEHLQSMTDAKLRKCPKCGKLKLRRLIGAGTGIIFKGSGFYETDYKSKDSSETQTSTKTETKSASSKKTAKTPKGDK